MRFAKFSHPTHGTAWGILRGDKLTMLSGHPFAPWRETTTVVLRSEVKLLAPVEGGDVLAFGRNYKAHAEESGDTIPKSPLLFIKATSSVTDPDAPIVLPRVAPSQVDYEAELAVIIGTTARHVSPERALDHVFGYTAANDVSARDCQFADGQWARGKSFDTFAPLGPWIETELDPGNVRVQGRLNGNIHQDANTSLLIFNIPYLISYLSQAVTLRPGTVLLTGTPAGCGFALKPPVYLKPGDVYDVEIQGIGTLSNPVIAEA